MLERLLVTERHRRRSNQSTLAGFAVPAMLDIPLEPSSEPLVATNAVGNLVLTRVSRTALRARYGFFECPAAAEQNLMPRIFSTLWGLSRNLGWENRCSSLSEATGKMRLPPRSVVVPYSLVEQASGEALTRQDCDRLMTVQGHIADKNGQQILVANLEDGQALLAATPALLGVYTRIDDWLGLLLKQVDQTLYLVDSRAAI